MIVEKVGVLYRGGPDSDARLHLAVGDQPVAPACAGRQYREVLSVVYPYEVTLFEPPSPALAAAYGALAEQLAIRVMAKALTPDQKDRLCRRCADDLL